MQRGALKTYTSIRYGVLDKVDACICNENIKKRLHNNCCRGLSPTFVDSDNMTANHLDGANMLLTNTLPFIITVFSQQAFL